jgi:hypothetical protein
MDPTRFDALTRRLSDPQSRRRLLGGALAAIGGFALTDAAAHAKGDTTLTTEGDRRRPNRQHTCLSASRTKLCYLNPKKGSSKERYGCKKCCESFRDVPEKPGSGKCCKPNGLSCGSAAECCLESCSAGLCQNTDVSFSPPPPVEVGDTNSGGPPPPPTCVATGGGCPAGCTPGMACPGCCIGHCRSDGICANPA